MCGCGCVGKTISEGTFLTFLERYSLISQSLESANEVVNAAVRDAYVCEHVYVCVCVYVSSTGC